MRKIITQEKKKFIILSFVVLIFIVSCIAHLSIFAKLMPYLVSHKVVLGASTKMQRTNSSLCFGAGADMSQLLPSSQAYVRDSKGEDLIDIAARLGMSCIRITNATDAFPNSDRTYSKNEWYVVLDKMQSKGIKAIILIEGPNVYQKNITSSYMPFLEKYIIASDVLSHPDVYGVDLYNEPVINSTNNLSLLKKAAQLIKAKSPSTQLTVGWWAVDTYKKDSTGQEIYKWDDYAAGKSLNSFIDFYAIHMYGFDKPLLGKYPDPYLLTQYFLSNVENGLKTQKPLLIEEFGAGNGSAISDQETLGSPELQANVYAGVYQAILDMHDPQIQGTIAYQFNTRSPGPDAWTIIKNNGDTLLPSAYVMQRFATGLSDVSFSLPFSPVPNDTIYTNADNGKSISIGVDDIVGLELSLDPTQTYSFSSYNSSILSQTQPLTYDPFHKKFDGVFYAKSTGTTILSVHSVNSSQEAFVLKISVN